MDTWGIALGWVLGTPFLVGAVMIASAITRPRTTRDDVLDDIHSDFEIQDREDAQRRAEVRL
jgi:hypothetical protein